MSKHQYRLDLRTMQLQNFRREPIATIHPNPIDTSLFANQRLQWNHLSFWHGVYGWTLDDGTVAVRYVPAEHKDEYLITVERPIDDELPVVATGAHLLKTGAVEM